LEEEAIPVGGGHSGNKSGYNGEERNNNGGFQLGFVK